MPPTTTSTPGHYPHPCCKESEWANMKAQLLRAETDALEAKRMASETQHETQTVFHAWQLQNKGVVDELTVQKGVLADQTKDLKLLLTADIKRTTREEERAKYQSKLESRLAWVVPLVVTTLIAVLGAMAMMVIDKLEAAAKSGIRDDNSKELAQH